MPLKDTIERIRNQPEPPNEESAKAQLILPILQGLGWRSDDPSRVFFEYTAGGGRVDIALRDEGRCVAFIEAKAPGKKLGDHVPQMLSYAFHEGVDICVLTTGLEWWFYLPREKGPPRSDALQPWIFALVRPQRLPPSWTNTSEGPRLSPLVQRETPGRHYGCCGKRRD